MCVRGRITFLMLGLLVQVSAWAEVISWTNSAGGQWNTAANWNPNRIPSANDIAVITNAGTYKVTLNSGPTLAGLVLGGGAGTQTLATAGEIVTLNGSGQIAGQARLELRGTLSGSAEISVEGNVAWDGGLIDSNVVMRVTSTGSVLIGGGATYSKSLLGTLTNAGTITYTLPGAFGLAGVLHNSAEGLFDIQCNNSVLRSGPQALLVNEGTLRKSVSVGGSSLKVPLVSSGVIDVQTGTLALEAGAVFNDGCQFIGAGTSMLDGHVTNVLSGALYSENLLLQDATLTGTGVLNGKITWGAGSLGSDAKLLLATNSQLYIGGGANYSRTLLGNLTNAGTITYAPPGPFGLAGVLHNATGGLFEIQWGSVFKSGPQALLVNEGTLRKSVSVGSSDVQVPLVNSGGIEAQTGVLVLRVGSVFNSGSRFFGPGTVMLDGQGTNILSGALYSENLLLQDATLTGTGVLNGKITWGAGFLGADAKLLVATNSELYIGGGANYSRILLGSLTNAGTITYTSPGPFGLAGLLHNAPGGLFDIQWNSSVFKSGPAALLVNQGVIRKSAGTATSGLEVPLNNTGTIEAQVGTLVLRANSVFDGSRFIGAGSCILDGATTNALAGTLYSENLTLLDSTLNGSGILSGKINWGAGCIGSKAKLLLATNSELHIGGGANYSRILLGSLTNAGTITYAPPGPFKLAGVLHNAPGGVFDIQWNFALFKMNPSAMFINDGVFQKSAGTAACDCEVALLNRGVVDIASGRLNFVGQYQQPSGDLLLRGGTVWSATPLDLAGGRLLGWGIVDGDLTNSGATVSPTNSGGVIKIAGRYFQRLAGSFEVALAGTDPGTNHSQLRVTGAAQLNGTISVRLLGPYVPAPADAFKVMMFASRKGDFARRNGLILLGHDRRLETIYSSTSMSLVTVEAPDPEAVTLQIGREGPAALVSWPLEFGNGTLYACTNFAQPAWATVPAVSNSFLDYPMLPQRWFRLTIP